MSISTEMPRVLIDQYQCFAEAGLKNNRDLMREGTQRGYRQVMKYIGQTARDGYALAAIEQGGNPIADIAVREAYPQKEFNIAFIPQSRPEIKVVGSVSTSCDKNGEGVNNGVKGNYAPGFANSDFTPAKVNIYVKQYPSVDIKYENKVDISV